MSRLFILDFDGTITTADTTTNIAAVGLKAHPELSQAWEEIVNAYTAEYTAYTASHVPESERTSLEAETHWLRGLKDVETNSFARVSASGLFQGIDREAWIEAGREARQSGDVVLRRGWEAFRRCVEDDWCIVSVSFAEAFVRGVLGVGEEVDIVANQPGMDGVVEGYEDVGELLVDSRMKGAVVDGMWDGRERVYLGDSGTDLEALMTAEIGVVICGDGDGNLLRMCRRIQVEVRHVVGFKEWEKERDHEVQTVLWWARDFEEVMRSGLVD